VRREEVLEALFSRLATWVAALGRPHRVAQAFRERDALYGRRIAWTRDGVRETGEARGIDDDGALIVFRGDSDPVRLDAGEVHLER
jgi:biotin-(acetyl-CoA carboxylase) ligase